MEKVVYLVAYEGGESYETEMREDAHCAHENGANVMEVRVIEHYVGHVRIEVRITFAWRV